MTDAPSSQPLGVQNPAYRGTVFFIIFNNCHYFMSKWQTNVKFAKTI